MTTTCLPQTAITTRTTTAKTTVSSVDRLRHVFAAVQLLRNGTERRLMRSTPSQSALESIESFPGLHR